MKCKNILLLCAMTICSASVRGQTWKVTSTMTAALNNGTLTISTTQNSEVMPDYSWIDMPWYEVRTSIQSIVIGNGITTIGNNAFRNCDKVTSLTIPNSVKTIGAYAFFNCSALPSITIPDAVTTIDDQAFKDCKSLTTVSIPVSVSHIGTLVFDECNSLTAIQVHADNKYFVSVYGVLYDKGMTKLMLYPEKKSGVVYVIPGTVKKIEDGAFNNASLTSVTMPNSVEEIKFGAFWNCTELTGITLPGSVKTIGEEAFYKCLKLTSIAIPASVEEIGRSVFAYCEKLTSITVDAANTVFTSDGGALYNKDKSLLHTCPSGKSGAFTIPVSVKKIGHNAFTGCAITSVTIPNSVTYIGNEVFLHCTNLQSVTMLNSVTDIGISVFHGCTNLTSITLPNTLTVIPDWTFYACTNLQSLTIPDRVETIGPYAFFACENLSSIVIPKSVIAIKWAAFDHCSALTSLTIPSSVKTIEDYVFSNCTGLKKVTVQWNTPLTVPVNIFDDVNTSAVTLLVPTGSKARYQAASVWRDFGTFTEYIPTGSEQTAIQHLKAAATNDALYITGIKMGAPLYIYNLSGQLLYHTLAQAEKTYIPLAWHGICIVVSGEQRIKVGIK